MHGHNRVFRIVLLIIVVSFCIGWLAIEMSGRVLCYRMLTPNVTDCYHCGAQRYVMVVNLPLDKYYLSLMHHYFSDRFLILNSQHTSQGETMKSILSFFTPMLRDYV